MGAYDNPKYFNARDYTAGAKNFTTAFTTGLKEGVARGEAKIADRKEYEKGIYEKGLELEEELTAAVDNNLKTKEEMDDALQRFYDEALKIDAPVKKGLFGAFATAKEKRLGDIDLQKMTKSFTDAAIPVNSIYDYVYTSGMSIDLDEDKSHESYEKKKAIHNAVKSGHFKTNFTYVSGEGFKTDLQIVDDNGKVLRSFTPQQAQSIMTGSGQKERLAIDEINKKQLDTTEKIIANGIDNKISEKTFDKDTGYVKASDEIITGINSAYGVSAFIIGDERTGKLDYEKLPGANKRLINQTFDNYVDLSSEMKVAQYKKRNPDTKLMDEQIGVIMNMPFEAGHGAFLTDPALKGAVTETNIKDIYNNSIQAKWDATQSWLENEMKGRSIVDKFYTKPPKVTTTDDPKQWIEEKKVTLKNAFKTGSDIAGATVSIMNTALTDVDNPAYNEEDAKEEGDKYGIPKTLLEHNLPDDFKNNFIGRVGNINKDGKARAIQDMRVDGNGNIIFGYLEGEVGTSETVGGVDYKGKEDLRTESTNYNIYDPQSMKNLYVAFSPSGKAGETAISRYADNVSIAYLNNPGTFTNTDKQGNVMTNNKKMDEWAKFIVNNASPEVLLTNMDFRGWLNNNAVKLGKNHPFAKLKARIDELNNQDFGNLGI